MALVTIKGKFMGVSLDQREFDGVKKHSVLIDLYQKDSPLKDKSVQVKTEELEMYQKFLNEYEEGQEISLKCTVNAYRNENYFRLVEVV